MTDPIEAANLDIYGSGELPWSKARDGLAAELSKAETAQFLGTVRPDGRPHSAGIGALWDDGDVYFTSGPGTRKSRNLAANPACTLSVRLTGVDLVLEGEAARVVDPDVLARIAAEYRKGGWPAEVDGDALTAPYSAQSAGRPPWNLYRLTIHTAIGVGTEKPFGATRWTFPR
ncbi:pyridoxamine 5'-phosphate oxidase family protein [Actinomadura fibrosa]|uniref:Pyridoxamine 5'-phosphate oxidase family protein n=1 Tax=Actinomadura fibrosa TaxID=111802 RepID=A0ABW2XPA1_9ACTN|nr:pyridoxamine 5'-phosphate oxidase family protein [Actinomadura fibrosa]